MANLNSELQVLSSLPDGLLDCPADKLVEMLDSPTMIKLKGQQEPPLFISVLLHGNEVSGWNGLRRYLAEALTLPRSVIIFIGNVHAAAANLRVLPKQQDYNRIWFVEAEPEATLARQVHDELRNEKLFAAIDLHNNTGHNPHYCVLTEITPENLGLARLFSDKAVLVREPSTVLARMFERWCPAVTLELGPVGEQSCEDRCYEYIKRCFALDQVPEAVSSQMQLYRSLARVHIEDNADFSFAGDDGAQHQNSTPLVLTGGVEGVNFHQLPEGMEFGKVSGDIRSPLYVLDVEHMDVTKKYIDCIDGSIVLKQAVTPAMYTTDPLVIRQDCLCYFMEPINSHEGA